MSESRFSLQNQTDFKRQEEDYRYNWHYLMLNYGYIPKDDFLNMDASDIDYLIEECNKIHESRIKQYKKLK